MRVSRNLVQERRVAPVVQGHNVLVVTEALQIERVGQVLALLFGLHLTPCLVDQWELVLTTGLF